MDSLREETWQASLEPGETLLWQGRPDGRLVFLWSRIIETVMGLGFAFGALVCLGVVVLLLPQPIALAVLPGVAIFSAGAFFFGFWPHYRDASRRRRTRYALTNRRAVVAEVDRQGRVSVKSYPIRLDTPLGGGHDRVIFATERRMARGRGYDADVGFERIGAEARVVHDHIIAIKARRAAEDA